MRRPRDLSRILTQRRRAVLATLEIGSMVLEVGTFSPVFALEQRPGMRDYWAVHLQLLPPVHDTAVGVAAHAAGLPEATAIELSFEGRRAAALMADGVNHGNWQPFLDQMRVLGARYAQLGVGFERWYAAVRTLQRRILPALVEAYGGEPSRLIEALSAGAEFIDFLMEIVSQRYFEVRQEDRFKLLVDHIKEHAIYLLDPTGRITSWNAGAQAIKGYPAQEVMGKSFEMFFPAVDRAAGKPARILTAAAATGAFEEVALRCRKDGSEFWAEIAVTAIRSDAGELLGFAKIVRDLTERKQIEAALEQRTRELERANHELEAFSYSVAHDLRSPLRGLIGFASVVIEDYGASLEKGAVHYLTKIQASARRMSTLIDGLLDLSRLSRSQIHREAVDLSAMARQVLAQLVVSDPERTVETEVDDALIADADPRLVRTLLENLLGNAWKFTGKVAAPRISVGTTDGGHTMFVRDNGAGFDSGSAAKLFAPFERMHSETEFAGTGIGLATVQRIVERHGGRIWAEAKPGQGATFFFTLGPRA